MLCPGKIYYAPYRSPFRTHTRPPNQPSLTPFAWAEHPLWITHQWRGDVYEGVGETPRKYYISRPRPRIDPGLNDARHALSTHPFNPGRSGYECRTLPNGHFCKTVSLAKHAYSSHRPVLTRRAISACEPSTQTRIALSSFLCSSVSLSSQASSLTLLLAFALPPPYLQRIYLTRFTTNQPTRAISPTLPMFHWKVTLQTSLSYMIWLQHTMAFSIAKLLLCMRSHWHVRWIPLSWI